jgi:hypothetical protein
MRTLRAARDRARVTEPRMSPSAPLERRDDLAKGLLAQLAKGLL